MRVENLEQLDVRRYDRYEVALVSPLELCRAELSKRTEHLVADKREQLERDEMVAGLLRVPEPRAHKREENRESENHPERYPRADPEHFKYRVPAEYRNE